MEQEHLKNCPICRKSSFKEYLKCVDFSVSKEVFTLQECADCGFVFTNPRPKEENIGPYYESKEYISHTDSNTGLISKIYKTVRSYAIRQKFKLVSKYSSGNTILDYGCGTGDFLLYCQNRGWSTTGIEPNKNARAVLEGKKIEAIYPNEISKLESDSHSVITLWHVLEHVHELDKTISEFNRILKKDGLLVIAVPNRMSYDAQYYKEFWAAYDVPKHLYHFSPNDVKRLFDSKGFLLKEIKPMVFDSFYVSMLSEKYKSQGNLLKAFFIGFTSNLLAFIRKNNSYSSQIYILTKKEAI